MPVPAVYPRLPRAAATEGCSEDMSAKGRLASSSPVASMRTYVSASVSSAAAAAGAADAVFFLVFAEAAEPNAKERRAVSAKAPAPAPAPPAAAEQDTEQGTEDTEADTTRRCWKRRRPREAPRVVAIIAAGGVGVRQVPRPLLPVTLPPTPRADDALLTGAVTASIDDFRVGTGREEGLTLSSSVRGRGGSGEVLLGALFAVR